MDLAGNEPFIQTNCVNNKLTQPKASQQNKITNLNATLALVSLASTGSGDVGVNGSE